MSQREAPESERKRHGNICHAPNDAAVTALAMSVAKLGFIRTQSLRAFTLAELGPIMEKVV